jgi:fatty-acid desaturase
MQTDDDSNAGLIAGLLIAAICVVSLFALLGFLWWRHQKVWLPWCCWFVCSIVDVVVV